MSRARQSLPQAKPAAQEQIRQGEEGLAVFRQQLDQGWSGYNQLLENIKGMEDNPMDPSEPGYDEWLQTLGGLKEQADHDKSAA